MKTAYHIVTGSMVMEDTDANSAVALHSDEWSFAPWPPEKRKEFVDAAVSDHKKEVAAAKEMGVDPPPPPAVTQVRPLYPDEQEALDKYNKDFAEAQKRLEVADKEEADAKAKAAQVAADREMVKRAPPVVDWDRPPPDKADHPADKGEVNPADHPKTDSTKPGEVNPADHPKPVGSKPEGTTTIDPPKPVPTAPPVTPLPQPANPPA